MAFEDAPKVRAIMAAAKAHRLWPGAHAQVLSDEIWTVYSQLSWLGPYARTVRLIDEILATPEPKP